MRGLTDFEFHLIQAIRGEDFPPPIDDVTVVSAVLLIRRGILVVDNSVKRLYLDVASDEVTPMRATHERTREGAT